ncbi:TetR/AcrR family transcriptional regulator [Candidatus Sulfurimonas marisnigri]|uniref:TetR/AcrR family transcriptional regulator n=1 Tax=Candidatus Sulfurimonas marisnigri TaxID=2740405 RepID=A0A7S7RQB4_9BACT|nr:TetR/AcrR family transcriptional regulator [Candidatus Sulfurimonas marisnigri]QOY55272.1 TetR/AcrR family transcriptional regulator [Candidatus Sulfurimonas marisnigri]
MAIIVDKVQKRKDIALSCKEIVFENGIKSLTISSLAKTAGVGKGTIYEYFKNKEDIVFEILNISIQERNKILESRLSEIAVTKDKIKLFSSFFYCDEDIELRALYKEFISIALSSPDKEMIEFQTECHNAYFSWFEKIIQDAIDNNEIIEESKKLARGLFVFAEGMFISSQATNSIDNLKQEIDDFIDSLFDLIEVKK